MKVLAPIAVFVLVALPAMATADAGVQVETDRHAEWRHAFHAKMSPLPAQAPLTVYMGDEVRRMPLAAAAELYADHMVALEERYQHIAEMADASGKYRQRGPSQHGFTEWAGHAGIFRISESLLSYSGPVPGLGCAEPGERRHATIIRVDNPGPVHGLVNRYSGASYSAIAAHGGSGSIQDLVTNQPRTHFDVPIYYAGASDFFCVEGRLGAIWAILNEPTVAGVVFGIEE